MGFKNFLINCLTAFFIVLRRFFFLIFYPYRTMRKISFEKDYCQLLIITGLVFLYFKFIYFLRDKPYPATLIFLIFVFNFFLTVFFFYFLSKVYEKRINWKSFMFTFSYSLLPTLIWFISTSILYIFLPPPRTFSVLGQAFSIFFMAYSLNFLVWKLILVYLAVRFSSKQNFFRTFYMIVLYLVWFLPYSVLLYYFRFFRVPFI